MNKWNDKPGIVCYFVGKEAYRLETSLNTSEVIEEVRQKLQEMFPDKIVPPPIDSAMTYWKLDPFSNGSYSYISAEQRYEDPSYLAQPIENQILFAGEATSTDSYGYAHGALMSARREVTRILFVYSMLQNPSASNAVFNCCNFLVLFLVTVLSFLRLSL